MFYTTKTPYYQKVHTDRQSPYHGKKIQLSHFSNMESFIGSSHYMRPCYVISVIRQRGVKLSDESVLLYAIMI